jgi:hypothetical protein
MKEKPKSRCPFCDQEHPPKQICKERLAALAEARKNKPGPRKGAWQS